MEDKAGQDTQKDEGAWKVEPHQLGREDAGMHSCELIVVSPSASECVCE